MDSTLTTLLADVRRKGSIPSHAGTGSADSDLIAHLNDSLIEVASEVIRCREGFFRAYKDHTVSSTSLRYRIPTRAIGNRLAAVLLLDSAGNVLRKLDEVPYSRLEELDSLTDCAGYHLEAGDVVLVPDFPSSTAVTLRMVYYLRPGEITSSLDAASGNCFTVTAVNTSTGLITLMASHGITTSSVIDIIKKEPPCEAVSIEVSPTATGASTVTVADASRVEIGDFVCLRDKAPKAQIPDAFYPVLAALAAKEFWASLGDSANVDRMERMIEAQIKKAQGLIAPRVEEGGRKIMSRYGALGK